MKVGKWYIVIGGLCFGFGTPPSDLLDRKRGDRPSYGVDR